MPLYNLALNRKLNTQSEEEKNKYKSTEIIHLYHDRIEVEQTIDSTNIWNPIERKIYGYLNCDKNPPFPEARAGQMYLIDTGGTVGNIKVSRGDAIECVSEYSPEGYEEVRYNWLIIKES